MLRKSNNPIFLITFSIKKLVSLDNLIPEEHQMIVEGLGISKMWGTKKGAYTLLYYISCTEVEKCVRDKKLH